MNRKKNHYLTSLLPIVLFAGILLLGRYPLLAQEENNTEAAFSTHVAPLNVMERKIRAVLTAEQEALFTQGVEPALIVLANGETLESFIIRTERAQAEGQVYKPVVPCVLLDTRKTREPFAADEVRTLLLRGETTDYTLYGGSSTGCGVPGLRGRVFKTNTARSLFIAIELHDVSGSGQLKIWPAHETLVPTVGLLAYDQHQSSTSSVIVSLCDDENLEPCAIGDLTVQAQDAATDIVLRVLGYFEPIDRSLSSPSATELILEKTTASPYWEPGQNSGDIYYDGGHIGLGTESPQTPLALNTGAGGEDVGITQSQVGDAHSLELTTSDGTNQATRLLLGGNVPHADIEFYRGSRGAEELLMKLDASTGNVGIGEANPSRRLEVHGGFSLRDDITDQLIARTARRITSGYAGGSSHENRIWGFLTPFERPDGTTAKYALWLASPEVYGGEAPYLYAFGSKNIRLGNVNNNWRRSEIELYNDNTSQGRILFRTGAWQDPGNIPGVETNVRMAIENNGQVWLRSGGTDSQLLMTDYLGDERVEMGYSSDQRSFALHQTALNATNSFLIHHASDITDPVFQFQTKTKPNTLTITDQGYIGVNTNTPDAQLTVYGVTHLRSNNPTLRFTDSSVGEEGAGSSWNLRNQNSAFKIYEGGRTNSPAVHIQSDGKVGIDTTQPAEALDVNGNIKLSGSIVSDGDICIGNCG